MAKVSIVIPVYRGARTVGPLVERLESQLREHIELEVVLVNDGSPDDSADVCRSIARARPWVLFVNLATNFSEHNAVMAGLNHCTGECAVIMDDDFQNPPSEVVKLVTKLAEGFDVVYSRYDRKRHSWFRNLGSRFNDRVASIMLNKPKDLYLSSFKAINRFVIDEIVKYRGPYPYIDGLILRTTRRYATVLCAHDERVEGKSGYTLRKLVALWMNMFTSFSILPLRVASVLGLVVAVIGVLAAILFMIEKMRDPSIPTGWASVITCVLLLSGIQLFALGMIGEYLGRLFLMEGGRPQFVVRDTVNVSGAKELPANHASEAIGAIRR